MALLHGDRPAARYFRNRLQAVLVGDCETLSQRDVAGSLGMTGGAAKVAIHRLREQFRKAVCHEIRQTVTSQEEDAAELRYLIEILSSRSGNP